MKQRSTTQARAPAVACWYTPARARKRRGTRTHDSDDGGSDGSGGSGDDAAAGRRLPALVLARKAVCIQAKRPRMSGVSAH
jgi:hypothetical protein